MIMFLNHLHLKAIKNQKAQHLAKLILKALYVHDSILTIQGPQVKLEINPKFANKILPVEARHIESNKLIKDMCY